MLCYDAVAYKEQGLHSPVLAAFVHCCGTGFSMLYPLSALPCKMHRTANLDEAVREYPLLNPATDFKSVTACNDGLVINPQASLPLTP